MTDSRHSAAAAFARQNPATALDIYMAGFRSGAASIAVSHGVGQREAFELASEGVAQAFNDPLYRQAVLSALAGEGQDEVL